MPLQPNNNTATAMGPMPFKAVCDDFRQRIKEISGYLAQFKSGMDVHPAGEQENKGEKIANLTLAFRHLEDAAMRIGKAIQADQGGESPLGGPATPAK